LCHCMPNDKNKLQLNINDWKENWDKWLKN
jgi:hypothetical protein